MKKEIPLKRNPYGGNKIKKQTKLYSEHLTQKGQVPLRGDSYPF